MHESQAEIGDLSPRPPYLDRFTSTTKPLFGLPTLLSRADATGPHDRPRDPGFVTDLDGEALEDPSADPARVGFESDPNLAWEKWDEFWRKMHGPRFLFRETADDLSMERMLRYDQVHRLPGGPTSEVSPPYQTPTTSRGELHVRPRDVLAAYRRPRWDGYADMVFATLEEAQAAFSSTKFTEKLVPEQQLMFRVNAQIPSREFIILPSARHRDPVSLVKLHYRRADVTREQWQAWWLEEHAPFILRQEATHEYVRRYAQFHGLITEPGDPFWHPEGSQVDGLTVMSFAGVTDLEDYLLTAGFAEIAADEARMIDSDRGEYWTGINYHIINRLYPEMRTHVKSA